MVEEIEDLQFSPLAISVRLSPFKSFLGGADINCAIGLTDKSGFYASPGLTYFSDKVQAYARYHLIALDQNLASIRVGFDSIFK